ncbi:imidazolonepropionase [Pseudaquabacterium rugosum]
MTRLLLRGAALATMDGATPWGGQPDGALLIDDGHIAWLGAAADLPAGLRVDEEIHLDGGVLLPGFVDAHTHLVYAGSRAHEFELRLQGASYETIARAGGGIRSTVAATRAADEATLLALALPRARALRAEGVTTLEIKSGYGLSEADEARCLRVARAVGAATGQTVRTTALPAHALPPEYAGRADDYVDDACRWLAGWHAQGLVDAVDAFCETIAFSPAQVERLFRAARALGLPVKLHAEQLSDSGGAALAARFQALSADHLEWLSDAGIAAMAVAGTVAVLLPGAFYFLRETRLPPVQALRAAGVPIALATDHNPGSSPTLSPLLTLNMGCTLFGLTPEEALAGMTRHGAAALGLHDRGRLAPGLRADLVHWAVDHPRELAAAFGQRPACRVWIAGQETRP